MKTIQQLRDQRAKLVTQARAILSEAEKAKRDVTAEEDGQFTKLMDEADAIGKEIKDREQQEQQAVDRVQRLEQMEAELQALNRHGIDGQRVAGSTAGTLPGGHAPGSAITDETRELAMRGWFLAQTMIAEPTDEMRDAARMCGFSLETRVLTLDLHSNFRQVKSALKSNVPGSGGALRLGEFMGSLETAMLAFGPMLEVAHVLRTSHANPLPWPHANDTGNTGRQIGESKAVAENDPTFGATTWGAYKFTSDEILVPFELLRDSGINLADVLGEMLGERLGRIQNLKYTVGTGAGTAYGIVTRSTLGKAAAGAAAITADELIDLQHSVPRAYRKGAGFMMHDSTVKAIRKLKDGDGQYLWQPGLQAGVPDTLLKWPVQTNDDMAEIATGQKTVLAGPFNKYKVRQVNRIRLYRLTERHRENDQDAFLAFIEADGNLLDPGTGVIRHLIQA